MSTPFETLTTLLAEVADLRHAAELLEWDERVYMPAGGAEVHGEMQATLRRLAHEKFTSDAVGQALDDLKRTQGSGNPDSRESRIVAVTARDYDKATKVPPRYVAEHALAVSAAQHAWGEARAASDFAAFLPHLQRVVELKREYVSFFPPAAHPYDTLLDDYEPGMTTADVQSIFGVLRKRQVALIGALAQRPQVDDSFLRVSYAERDLWDFAVEVITAFGFDWTHGRQDKSAHPFATSFGSEDVRITTRWVEDQPLGLLFGTMHEAGHALYEQGVDRIHHRTQLEGGASLGVHESQSRLWENLVGRSLPFWEHFYPMLQARCRSQLAGVTVEQFYKAINKVERSLIRVEADEATYNLHVMLRLELEIALIEGSLAVKDLPDAWNGRVEEYLGIRPPSDKLGVLQDIHWSAGLFGYFATYALGNLIAAQLWEKFEALEPSRDGQIGRGDFSRLRAWLKSELHQHGRMYQPKELVARITGGPIDPEPYLRYLEGKYTAVYA
ncbi:MAG: carboxypeptidase M32 [Acidobacteria bacterium]|nr:carboxypeptidase M32 [Acidobacteriota bacterium]